MAIDWQYQTDCYNRQNKTNYKTPRALLKVLYKKLGSCGRIAKALYISPQSVWVKMKVEKIQLNMRGWDRMPCCEVAIANFLNAHGNNNVANMAVKEIAIKIGFAENYVRTVLEKMCIKYKKMWDRKKKP